jgi:hypothetical protein
MEAYKLPQKNIGAYTIDVGQQIQVSVRPKLCVHETIYNSGTV